MVLAELVSMGTKSTGLVSALARSSECCLASAAPELGWGNGGVIGRSSNFRVCGALCLGGDGDQGRGAHCERADGEGEGLEHQTSPIWDLGECAGGGPFDPDDSLMVESD